MGHGVEQKKRSTTRSGPDLWPLLQRDSRPDPIPAVVEGQRPPMDDARTGDIQHPL